MFLAVITLRDVIYVLAALALVLVVIYLLRRA
jgi:flagellar biogenesis protein FliO